MTFEIVLEAEAVHSVSLPLLQYSGSVLSAVSIRNTGSSALEHAVLSIRSIPSFFRECAVPLPVILEKSCVPLELPVLEFDTGMLRRLAGTESGYIFLRVQQNGMNITTRALDISLLPPHFWTGINVFPESLAAFVRPQDAAVSALLSSSSDVLRQNGFSSSEDGYSRGRQGAWERLCALWHVLKSCGLDVSPGTPLAQTGQKVLAPSQVLERRHGSPLDLALLLAACCEQCGLNPCLVAARDRIFISCFLSDRFFPFVVSDDSRLFLRDLQLQTLVVIDPIKLARQTDLFDFPSVCAASAASLAAEDDLVYIDIARARREGIHPLPVEKQPALSGPLFGLDATVGPFTVGTPPGGDDPDLPLADDFSPCSTRLERWQRKLLDLTLRNNLLHFRATKKTMELSSPDPAAVEDTLADGHSVLLLSMPDAGLRREQANASRETAGRRSRCRELFSSLNPKEMDDRLTLLYRASRSALQEGGANVLFLAFGFLQWIPGTRDVPCKAPLVLIPVKLERKSAKGGFSLSLGDDEPCFNLTLLEMLRKDFNITALDHLGKDLPRDEHGLDIPFIWRTVLEAVEHQPGWAVFPALALGIFSFAKYLMWADLAAHSDIIFRNPVLRHLLETPDAPYAADRNCVAPSSLDTLIAPQQVMCPLAADSSQLAAVMSAFQGRDFVLIGPPGTGKSQTIANIIAQSLGEGKRVLFVAEKAAALDVVYRRLKGLGLGSYCLELHSNKTSKVDVLRQLQDALSVARPEESPEWDETAGLLARTRDELNRQAAAMHAVHANGLTLYQGIGAIAINRQLPVLPCDWQETAQTAQGYADLLYSARELSRQGGEAQKLAQTSLRVVARQEWSPLWEEQLLNAAQCLASATEELTQATASLVEATGLCFSLQTAGDVFPMRHLVQHIAGAHGKQLEFVLRPYGQRCMEDLSRALLCLEAYTEAESQLSVPYAPEAVHAGLEALDALWRQGCASWWPKSWFVKRKVASSLRLLTQNSRRPDAGRDLSLLLRMQDQYKNMESYAFLGKETDNLWRGLQSDMAALREAAVFFQAVQEHTPYAVAPEYLDMFLQRLALLLGAENTFLGSEALGGAALEEWSACADAFIQKLETCAALAGGEKTLFTVPLGSLVGVCAELSRLQPSLPVWCSWNRTCSQLDGQGLMPLAQAVLDGAILPGQSESALKAGYSRWWVPREIEQSDIIKYFVSHGHDEIVSSFQQADRRLQKFAIDKIGDVLRGTAFYEAPPDLEMAVLQRETIKKNRHMPIRKLLSSIPEMLRRLTPCLLMSPLSVAQFLEAGTQEFDLVIFDEASQIPVWDAAGAMARGKQVIVVGDPKQLPPTTFFNRAEEDGDEAEELPLDADDMESVLDQCLSALLPRQNLSWHYRSRHESLISFSNQCYYDGSLITFPPPETQDHAVFSIKVQGIYDRGGHRINRIEAEMLASHLVARLRDPAFAVSGQSVGVVTFNIQQQHYLEDLLDAYRRDYPDLEPFFSDTLDEPVIVKNLENIQGDERDIIYFSTTFGPDKSGKVSLNFGALNNMGGERRLNVAVSRAREELVVVTSLAPEDISLERTRSRGVHDLRLFLEYASRGVARVWSQAASHQEPADFELAVASALTEKGWEVRTGIGDSLFRIPLAVVHPEHPDVFLAGIECDNVQYASAATAKDRNRLRGEVLQRLGWNILKIWAVDWWRAPVESGEALHTALQDLLAGFASSKDTGLEDELTAGSGQYPDGAEVAQESPGGLAGFERDRLRLAIEKELEHQSPLHETLLCQRVAERLCFRRVDKQLRERVIQAGKDVAVATEEDSVFFFWKKGEDPACCAPPDPNGDGWQRHASEMAIQELIALARQMDGVSSPDPARAMADSLRIKRLTAPIRKRLEAAWKQRKKRTGKHL